MRLTIVSAADVEKLQYRPLYVDLILALEADDDKGIQWRMENAGHACQTIT